MAVRDAHFRFFLRGRRRHGTCSDGDTAESSTFASAIAAVQARGLGINGLRQPDLILQRPLLNVNLVKDVLGVTLRTAGRPVEQPEAAGLMRETASHRRPSTGTA